VAAGNKLKMLRNRRNITVRQVEKASVRIAEAKGDKRFRISNGWLAQLENGISEPSICKLFTLSAIYHADFRELSRLYNVDIDEIEKYALIANPNLTQLCPEPSMASNVAGLEDRDEPRTRLGSSIASPSSSSRTEIGRGVLSGYIGLTDYTMYPLIRPGAVVEIDTNQKNLNSIPWQNEFERPIFFIELRDEYACGWCELQGSQLLIVPYYPSSQVTIRSFTFRRDAEIVGRVVAYNTRCVDSLKKEKK
jgi:transcriptional regulator with XRE-family HTH domain